MLSERSTTWANSSVVQVVFEYRTEIFCQRREESRVKFVKTVAVATTTTATTTTTTTTFTVYYL